MGQLCQTLRMILLKALTEPFWIGLYLGPLSLQILFGRLLLLTALSSYSIVDWNPGGYLTHRQRRLSCLGWWCFLSERGWLLGVPRGGVLSLLPLLLVLLRQKSGGVCRAIVGPCRSLYVVPEAWLVGEIVSGLSVLLVEFGVEPPLIMQRQIVSVALVGLRQNDLRLLVVHNIYKQVTNQFETFNGQLVI